MGKKDLYQSDFYEDNGRFADVFNGILFAGRQVLRPEELQAADSVLVQPERKGGGKKIICDKIRRWQGKYLSLLVLENQSYVDYGMVFRVMGAEALGYEEQRRERFRKGKYRGGYDPHEYLSRMKKGEKFTPIITLVLYLGKDRLWDGETTLHGMLELEEEIRPYVNDFKLNLFDYHDREDFSMFRTENRLLFEMLSCGKDRERMYRLLNSHREESRVDEESAKAILGILGVKTDLAGIKKTEDNGKESYDMCKAFDDYKEEGRREGREEGHKEGRKEGREEGRKEGRREGELTMALANVRNLMKNRKTSCEEALEILGISGNMYEKIRTMV